MRYGRGPVRSSPIFAIVCLALAIIAPVRAARADEPAADPAAGPGADPRLTAAALAGERAEALAQRKRAAEARAEWGRAAAGYAAVLRDTHDDNLRLPLAVAEEGRGQLLAAAEQLRALARSSSARPEVASAGAARLAALLPRLGQLDLDVSPHRTSIRFGLATAVVSPLPEPLLLLPGTYTFLLEANGFRSQEVTISVGAGQRLARRIELSALSPGAPAAAGPAPSARVEAEPPARLSPLVLAGVATTGVLVVAGVGTGLTALHRHSQFEDEPSASRRQGYADSGRGWALATDVLFGAALAVAAGTTYLYLRADERLAPSSRSSTGSSTGSPRSEARRQHRVYVVPWAGADRAGIGLTGAL